MNSILETARKNQERAWQVVRDAKIEESWNSIGAEVHLVGSLRTGLLMKHRDIDFHIYTPQMDVAGSFAAMAKIASNPSVKRVNYVNLLSVEDCCLEWHAWYEDCDGALWQLDMMHIVKGSRYDGYFEGVADRISEVLTDETRDAILLLKNETPDDEKIMGIEYYLAVLRDDIRTYPDFVEWRRQHPVTGIVEWSAEEIGRLQK